MPVLNFFTPTLKACHYPSAQTPAVHKVRLLRPCPCNPCFLLVQPRPLIFTPQEVEVAVALLHELGEGAPEDSLKPEGGALAQLALALMSQTSLPCCRHPLVALAVLESHVRYLKLLQAAPHILPLVMAAFLDDRGLRHPSEVGVLVIHT